MSKISENKVYALTLSGADEEQILGIFADIKTAQNSKEANKYISNHDWVVSKHTVCCPDFVIHKDCTYVIIEKCDRDDDWVEPEYYKQLLSIQAFVVQK